MHDVDSDSFKTLFVRTLVTVITIMVLMGIIVRCAEKTEVRRHKEEMELMKIKRDCPERMVQ